MKHSARKRLGLGDRLCAHDGKQIKRAIKEKKYPDIANFTAEPRAEALQKAEAGCFIHNYCALREFPCWPKTTNITA